ncbi:MAG: hydrolase [Gammaproteobacteria bacterium]|nr:MAG: hydrolase [Gammaproteobacteria bacterium]
MFTERPTQYPCPCCGYVVYRQQPGNHEVCPICRWEDDLSQLRFAGMIGGVNDVSLIQAQKNFIEFGGCSRRKALEAQRPLPGKQRDTAWRPFNPDIDNIEVPQRGEDYANTYPFQDTTVLYYWRPTYWRRISG